MVEEQPLVWTEICCLVPTATLRVVQLGVDRGQGGRVNSQHIDQKQTNFDPVRFLDR
uniref:Uncharacterized protein n=1 Tax=Physcomitrium patens TaxID=3218 RepID=A0A2K1KES7_PHYPA|nr:hypothetical protein PHYPA_008658 [Physcomitrium patens]